VESSAVCKPADRSDGGGPERQRCDIGKYKHREPRNAEMRLLLPEKVQPVL
jgi:hypothetical protein